MEDIYSYVSNILDNFTGIIYADMGEKGEEVAFTAIYQAIIKDNPLYDAIILDFLGDRELSIIQVKRMFIYILASNYVIYNHYLNEKGINEDTAELVDELLSMSYNEVVNRFLTDREFGRELIDVYDISVTQNYIFNSESKREAVEDNLFSSIIRLNPFEILSLPIYKDSDEFTASEWMILELVLIYERTAEYLNVYEFEIEDYDALFVDTFLDYLEDRFPDALSQNQALSYLLANVYESSFFFKNSKLIKSVDIDECLNEFLNNPKWAYEVIDEFIEANSYLNERDLLERRLYIKKLRKFDAIKKLNPFVFEEEKHFKEIVKRQRKQN